MSLVALGGTLLTLAYPLATRALITWRETAAADRLRIVVEAQQVFRAGAGRGGYSSSLASLSTPCPGEERGALRTAIDGERDVEAGYAVMLRAYSDAPAVGTDCHGRPTAPDFFASAVPVHPGADGLRAMAVSAAGRIFVFFDGVAPREIDIEPGGLAMPLDRLRKIP
ncbi:MAG: hypothetical protein LC791_13425 [Acidobacteria bacterium]|nr:hypothetical protein [Acidobacteriota bacterium]